MVKKRYYPILPDVEIPFIAGKKCTICGVVLTQENWPKNARKYKGKVWKVCTTCFKLSIANSFYKAKTGLTLIRRPKPTECELCGKTGLGLGNYNRIHWHHWNDDDTSQGLWLCLSCHQIVEVYEKKQDAIKKYVELKQILSNPEITICLKSWKGPLPTNTAKHQITSVTASRTTKKENPL